jgi:hypothetical protein
MKKGGDNNFKFKNARPPSPYPEREIYEALCRGETLKVILVISINFNFLSLFLSLSLSKDISKAFKET